MLSQRENFYVDYASQPAKEKRHAFDISFLFVFRFVVLVSFFVSFCQSKQTMPVPIPAERSGLQSTRIFRKDIHMVQKIISISKFKG